MVTIFLELTGEDVQKEKGKHTAREAMTYISSYQKQSLEYFASKIILITGLMEGKDFF